MRCKKKREMENTSKPKRMKNGAYMVKGECTKCGTKMSAIVSADSL